VIGALADALHRAPMAVGRADGWGHEDTMTALVVLLALMGAVALLGRLRYGWTWPSFDVLGGRTIMPVAFGCMLWAAYNGWVLLMGRGLGMLLGGPSGVIIGTLSAGVAVLLLAGWWLRKGAWMREGMLLTSVLLFATSVTIWATPNVGNISAGYNVPWGVLVFVSWLIEVRDKRRPGVE